jgi:hypothetical protein
MPLIRNRHGFRTDLEADDLDGATFTYAITDGSAVKIGKSASHPILRLRELQVGNPRPLRLVGYSVSTSEAEAHRRLRDALLRGEWYRAGHPAVRRFLARLDWVNPASTGVGILLRK